MPTRRSVQNRHKALKFCIRAIDILTMLMAVIYALLWGTGSHYLNRAVDNMFWERQLRYELHPALVAVDVLFALLLVAAVAFSVLTRYNLMRDRRIGLVFLPVTLAVTLLWGILYPVLTHAATRVPSSLMGFCVAQAAVYAILAAVPTVVIFRSDRFIY